MDCGFKIHFLFVFSFSLTSDSVRLKASKICAWTRNSASQAHPQDTFCSPGRPGGVFIQENIKACYLFFDVWIWKQVVLACFKHKNVWHTDRNLTFSWQVFDCDSATSNGSVSSWILFKYFKDRLEETMKLLCAWHRFSFTVIIWLIWWRKKKKPGYI